MVYHNELLHVNVTTPLRNKVQVTDKIIPKLIDVRYEKEGCLRMNQFNYNPTDIRQKIAYCEEKFYLSSRANKATEASDN